MNEQHAQFFRELKELLGKYSCCLNATTPDVDMQFWFAERTYWNRGEFNKDSETVGEEPIDAAQKESKE